MENDNESLAFANFTLEAEANSVTVADLAPNTVYRVRAAAYNRQGVGPFSEPVLIRVDPDFLFFNPDRKSSTAATTTSKKSDGTPMTNPEVVSPPELAPRFNLILQGRSLMHIWRNLIANILSGAYFFLRGCVNQLPLAIELHAT